METENAYELGIIEEKNFDWEDLPANSHPFLYGSFEWLTADEVQFLRSLHKKKDEIDP